MRVSTFRVAGASFSQYLRNRSFSSIAPSKARHDRRIYGECQEPKHNQVLGATCWVPGAGAHGARMLTVLGCSRCSGAHVLGCSTCSVLAVLRCSEAYGSACSGA